MNPDFAAIEEALGFPLFNNTKDQFFLFEIGDHEIGMPSRALSAPYTLTGWQILTNNVPFFVLWAQGNHRTVEECIEAIHTGLNVHTPEELKAALEFEQRGLRIIASLQGPEGHMDLLCLGNGQWHAMLYDEFDPEPRLFQSAEEVLECYQQAFEQGEA